MDLRERFKEELKTAMKAKEAEKVSTLRMIGAKLKDLDIGARPKGIEQVGEEEIIAMLKGMIKSRRESMEMYQQANRSDLADKEESEIVVIETFLPAQLDDAGIAKAVDEAMAQTGAASVKDMGKVMAFLKENYGAVIDFSKVNPLVKAKLS
ncbi:gatB/YqeY domain protein [Commensalibacter intestini A911]|uniref:Aspartyl-tRNA amidotransferase n=2 Tax=Commensalibacter intestini TaxID=479936 RepID=A0A251ZUI0_9PROT|nr:GatB/YqeY domain-containing protein [Commensalibacter intestini]EHD14293.1 gatB/YqeY domain protein [Commensalibacter intestini A911]OUI78318.1 aspartyl-tRNA amidotransferase [Commensalibacter intestini]